MDATQIAKLSSFIRQGRVILFTGAGFSMGAQSRSEKPLPSATGLAEELWNVAFPGVAFENEPLGEIYEAAVRQASTDTTNLMTDLLTVDPNSLDEGYRIWFSFPWHRVYTLNIDNLAEAADLAFDLPRPIKPLSALTDSAPAAASDEYLELVHLNGNLHDLPHVTFSQRQYGERLAGADLWYRNLSIELQTQPVLFVGSSLDEPPLWAYVEARGQRAPTHETRPGSFLVAPQLGRAKQVALGGYNVSWVEAEATDFASSVLAELVEEAEEGRAALVRRRANEDGPPDLSPISDLLDDSQDDEREFLLGREPRWSDITIGYAVARTFDAELAQAYSEIGARLVVLIGTAGAGKSTSAMRLAVNQSAAGIEVAALSTEATSTLHELRQKIKVSGIDVLLIDDADRFGKAGPSFIVEVLEDNPSLRVIACVKSTSFRTLGHLKALPVTVLEKTVPDLGDEDVDALLDSLDKANRLGALKGKTRRQQREDMRKKFGRQLLVALLEVTQGVRFEQKIDGECEELQGAAPLLYAVASLASHTGGPLSDQELYVAAGDATAAKEQIDLLTARHLLIRNQAGRLLPRHRVVAEQVVRYYQNKGIIAQVCTALASGLASGAPLGELRSNRPGRLLIRLLTHGNLIKLVYRGQSAADKADIRSIYDSVEVLLRDDYHYWLQRGSFETEEGDLGRAKLYLDQARGMAPGDNLVRAEWSYMTLKRAADRATEAGAAEEAETAFAELEELIEKRGDKDEYAYHILGSQGLVWARRAPLAFDEEKKLLERLLRIVTEGKKKHPDDEFLPGLRDKIENTYLKLATTGG